MLATALPSVGASTSSLLSPWSPAVLRFVRMSSLWNLYSSIYIGWNLSPGVKKSFWWTMRGAISWTALLFQLHLCRKPGQKLYSGQKGRNNIEKPQIEKTLELSSLVYNILFYVWKARFYSFSQIDQYSWLLRISAKQYS